MPHNPKSFKLFMLVQYPILTPGFELQVSSIALLIQQNRYVSSVFVIDVGIFINEVHVLNFNT